MEENIFLSFLTKKIFNIQCTTILFLQFLILTKLKILQIPFLTNIFQILLMD